MLQYSEVEPRVYVETTVVSYLVARPSRDAIVQSRQRATQRLWEEYSDHFEFVVSDIVLTEASRGDAIVVQRRFEELARLPVLDTTSEAMVLVDNLINAGLFQSTHVRMLNILPLPRLIALNT